MALKRMRIKSADVTSLTYAAIYDERRLLDPLVARHGQEEDLVRSLLEEWTVLFVAHEH